MGLAVAALDQLVRTDLTKWFGPQVDTWTPLRIYRIRHALPRVTAPGSPAHHDGELVGKRRFEGGEAGLANADQGRRHRLMGTALRRQADARRCRAAHLIR